MDSTTSRPSARTIHAAVHGCDAPFDFRDGWFDFGSHVERLTLNAHLALRAA
jgi:hypothetical protein